MSQGQGNNNNRDNDDNRQRSPTSPVQQQQRHRLSPQALRRRQEQQLSEAFSAVVQQKISSLNRWKVLQQEQDAVWKFLKSVGVMEGTTAAILAFVGLNRVPRYWARRVHTRSLLQKQQQQQQQQGYVLEKTKTANQQQQQPTNSPFTTPTAQQLEQQVTRSRHRFLFTTLELLFDSAMSIGVGISTAIIVTDQKEAIKSLTDIPLQPGTSLLSNQTCSSLIDEYRKQWKLESRRQKSHTDNSNNKNNINHHHQPFDRREILQDPHDRVLQVLLQITQNCQHRQVMEQRVQEEHGLLTSNTTNNNKHVGRIPIPEQGVMPETEDPLLRLMLLEEGKDYQDEIYSYQDVANFVKDQHEDGN